MSSDNYYLIRKLNDEFLVTMECASVEEVAPLAKASGKTFPTLREAGLYANSEYSEYGTVISDECWDEGQATVSTQGGMGESSEFNSREDSQREGSESEASPS